MSTDDVFEIRDLCLAYRDGDRYIEAIDSVSFSIRKGEVFGLVGESGCGKSSLAYNLLGYRTLNAEITRGQVLFKGLDILQLESDELQQLRGARISLVPQNPTTALNPVMRVGKQILESVLLHGAAESGNPAEQHTFQLLEQVGLPQAESIARRFPHQLSGGQQQRVCIAIALACNPEVLVLDEPTTGLDVTTQAQILALLQRLRERLSMSMLYVTHDLGVLAQIADRVGVMYAGRMVEIAPTETLFNAPRHPYSQGLIASVPRLEDTPTTARIKLRGLLHRDELPEGCPFTPRCDHAAPACHTESQILEVVDAGHSVACWRWRTVVASQPPHQDDRAIAQQAPEPGTLPSLELRNVSLRYGRRAHWFNAWLPRNESTVQDVSFEIAPGETYALVGESGSGKSTIARAISGLLEPHSGVIRFGDQELPGRLAARSPEVQRRIQYIFQNPDASLNPRMRVFGSLWRPLNVFLRVSRKDAQERIIAALDEVRLDASYGQRFPDQLSGGERQRVAIARALVADPALLLCDEILSALDVSVQTNIIELLHRLREEIGASMLFISHDLAVVRSIADRVGVLYRGSLVEHGVTDAIFSPPFHPYTHELLLAVPGTTRFRQTGVSRFNETERQSAASGTGCKFAARCPVQKGPICINEAPPWRQNGGVRLRCHLTLSELSTIAKHNGWSPTDSEAGVHDQ